MNTSTPYSLLGGYGLKAQSGEMGLQMPTGTSQSIADWDGSFGNGVTGGNTPMFSGNYESLGYTPAIRPELAASKPWYESMFGGKNADGSTNPNYAGIALGGVQTGFNIWQGMNQLKMAKDQLNFTKDAFNKNYAAQQQSTNTALADRQSARVASNAGAYQSVGEYMNQNRIA